MKVEFTTANSLSQETIHSSHPVYRCGLRMGALNLTKKYAQVSVTTTQNSGIRVGPFRRSLWVLLVSCVVTSTLLALSEPLKLKNVNLHLPRLSTTSKISPSLSKYSSLTLTISGLILKRSSQLRRSSNQYQRKCCNNLARQ